METLYGRKGIREAFFAGMQIDIESKEQMEERYQLFLQNHSEFQSKITGEEVAEIVSNMVNNYNRENQDAFLKKMSRDHLTLQQSFTRLVLRWIEMVASDEYRTDLRNQDSHEVCKIMVEGFQKVKGNSDYLPSNWLRTI